MGADPVGQAEGEPERKWRKKDTKRSGCENKDCVSHKQCSREPQEGGNDRL